MTGRQLVIFVAITILSCSAVDGHRILLLTADYISHARAFANLGDILADDGHEVYIGLSETFPPMDFLTHTKFRIIKHAAPYEDYFTMDPEILSAIFQKIAIVDNMIVSWRENEKVLKDMCANSLTDERYFKTLAGLNFDLAIVDTFPLSRCLLILAYDLGLPTVSVTTAYEPWLMKTPALPSFVPSNFLPNRYTDKMNFFERLYNLWQNIDWNMSPRLSFLDETFLQKHIRNKEKITIIEIISRSLLFFIDCDPILDYPRPTMPNEINIGGISLRTAQPLPGELKEFMDESEEGVIVMTFGGTDIGLPPEILTNYLKAFSQINLRVIWKYHQDVPLLPPNVKIAKWLPQQDLLGHPSTKLFITHCGNSGQFEALYHGVPMLGLPVYGDQPYNCKRMEALGFGICLKRIDIKTEELVKGVEEILSNSTYRKNIKLAAEIYRDNPKSSHEKFLYWINHVLKFGGNHLRSHALDLPWYQYLMLDILGFVFLMALCVILAVWIVVNIILKHHTHS